MRIPALEEMAQATIESTGPKSFKYFYPRRIACPTGYLDPKYYSAVMADCTLSALQTNKLNEAAKRGMLLQDGSVVPTYTPSKTDSALLAHVAMLTKYQVPTYFVAPQFMLSVAATEPPRDWTFGDIKMPVQSMLFVLPLSFVTNHIKWRVPFIGISKVEASRHEFGDSETIQQHIKDTFLIHAPLFPDKGLPMSLAGWFPFHYKLEIFDAEDFKDHYEDGTEIEKEYLNSLNPAAAEVMFKYDCPVPNFEEEPKLLNYLALLAFKLVVVLTTKGSSGFIVEGEQTRKEWVSKSGKERVDALWSPNFVGKNYKIQVEKSSLGGTHASPIWHVRRGHIHTFLTGKGRVNRETRWLPAILVNPPEHLTKEKSLV